MFLQLKSRVKLPSMISIQPQTYLMPQQVRIPHSKGLAAGQQPYPPPSYLDGCAVWSVYQRCSDPSDWLVYRDQAIGDRSDPLLGAAGLGAAGSSAGEPWRLSGITAMHTLLVLIVRSRR